VNLSSFFGEVTVVAGVAYDGTRTEHELEIGTTLDKCNISVSFSASVPKSYLSLFSWSVPVPSVANLAFSAEFSKQIVRFELVLLVLDHPRYFEDVPG